jgi:hypothetical protein
MAVLALLATGGGCHSRAARTPHPPTAEQEAVRGIWQSVYYPIFDSVTQSAGLSRLRTTALARGQREIRIWIGGGLGYPQDLYRFVENHGRVSGELVLYWHAGGLGPDERPGETFHDLMLYSQGGRCSGFAVGAAMGTCRGEFVGSPDWKAVLRRAEAEGLWTLPDESSLPPDGMMVLDGWGITVELRGAARYRAYHYGNPDAHKWPEAAKAVRIARALDTVSTLLRQPDVVRTYRGVTSGAYRSEFVDCASGERWQFYDELRSLAERSKVTFAPAADSGARYLVEVVGELTPGWLARRWQSPYARVLQVTRLVAVQPSPNGACPERR